MLCLCYRNICCHCVSCLSVCLSVYHITSSNWKMVQDRRIVSVKVVCTLWNGYVADDLGWSLRPKTTPISTYCIAFHIFMMDKLGTSNLGHRLISLQMTSGSWKGHDYVTWPVLNFTGPIHEAASGSPSVLADIRVSKHSPGTNITAISAISNQITYY